MAPARASVTIPETLVPTPPTKMPIWAGDPSSDAGSGGLAERTATTNRNGFEMASSPATARTSPSALPATVNVGAEPDAEQSAGRRAPAAPRNGVGSTPRLASRSATLSPGGPGGPCGPVWPGEPGAPVPPGAPFAPVVPGTPGGPGDPGVPGGPCGPAAPIVTSNSSVRPRPRVRDSVSRYVPGPTSPARTATTCSPLADTTMSVRFPSVTSGFADPKSSPRIVIR